MARGQQKVQSQQKNAEKQAKLKKAQVLLLWIGADRGCHRDMKTGGLKEYSNVQDRVDLLNRGKVANV